ncbi:glycosyltransferase family 2 protein [Brevundimonas sp.]|uniref:glycosyltransferase family 2 protein n=1 Tax=Brevundimonas sp. TaxID=1871086 RepID=UPI003D0E5A72
MQAETQIIVPIAGSSAFFDPAQFFFPKPLLEVGGRLMIERVIENLLTVHPNSRFIFIVQRDDVVRFSLDQTLRLLTSNRCEIVELSAPTRGALCSILMAIGQIAPKAPVIVSNADQIIDLDFSEFVGRMARAEADAGVICFESVHPRWSYVRAGPDNTVLEAAEKRVISKDAIAGVYYFKSGEILTDAAMSSIKSNASVDGQFYVSPALNEVILSGGKVLFERVDHRKYHSFYSPEKIRAFEDDNIMGAISHTDSPAPIVNVVIPAAGEGSRFKAAGFTKPKPFIDVLNKPMIQHVIGNVQPAGAKIHVLARADHVQENAAEIEALRQSGAEVHLVDALTEGTACTVLLARKAFDNASPLIVANSDQYVDFSVDDFVRDAVNRNLDGSILVFRDTTLNPKWSFAKLGLDGLVVEVAEKSPISDLATIGIYYFRRGSDFVRSAIDMIVNNDRVNNEFYTCPVYNYMIESGLRIGVFEVPVEGMHGLGTPEDLATYLARN